MLKIIPTGETLGATIEGVDLAKPLDRRDFAAVLRALGEYSVLRFPAQRLDAAQLKAFAGRFGSLEINVAGTFQEPGHPEIIILTNILPDPTNTYLSSYRGGIVDEVNGKKIRKLNDLAAAFAEKTDRFVLRLIGDGPPLVLDPKEVESARERIKTRYNVGVEQNLNEQPADKPASADPHKS